MKAQYSVSIFVIILYNGATEPAHIRILMNKLDSKLNVSQRFVIVDDDSINNMVSRFIILRQNKDAEIHVFTDPELALFGISELVSSSNNDLETIIFLDINMPIMSGWDFLQALEDLGTSALRKFRIYMLSSSLDPKDKQKIDTHSMIAGFFSKPLTINHLDTISGL